MTRQERAFLEEVFYLQCISCLNSFYYEERLATALKFSYAMEFVLAATASGSAIGAFSFFRDGSWGRPIWIGFTLMSAIIAIIKPLYTPSKKIQMYTRQHQSYHNNYFATLKLIYSLKQADQIVTEHRKRLETIYDRHVQISADDEPVPIPKVLKSAQNRCGKQLPLEDFWRHWSKEAASEALEVQST